MTQNITIHADAPVSIAYCKNHVQKTASQQPHPSGGSGARVGSDLAAVQTARQCHETLERYRRIIGDRGLGEWHTVPRWRRQGYVKGVFHARGNPNLTPEVEHDLWYAFYMQHGWNHGKKYSEAHKTHPCLVPWNRLPAKQQFKSELYLNIARQPLTRMPFEEAVSAAISRLIEAGVTTASESLVKEALSLLANFRGQMAGRREV